MQAEQRLHPLSILFGGAFLVLAYQASGTKSRPKQALRLCSLAADEGQLAAPMLAAWPALEIAEQRVRWPVALDAGELADALVQVCNSPLGPLAGGATLRGIPLRDRLCEMDFELPLSGGDVRDYPTAPVTLAAAIPDPAIAVSNVIGTVSPGVATVPIRAGSTPATIGTNRSSSATLNTFN